MEMEIISTIAQLVQLFSLIGVIYYSYKFYEAAKATFVGLIRELVR